VDSGQAATQAELLRALSSLASLEIRGEGGTTLESGALDNVAFLAATTNETVLLVGQFTGGAELRLEWPLAVSGFVLESSPTLYEAAWGEVPFVPDAAAAVNRATVPVNEAQRFYRLRKR
jgi:hypothetical protein